MTIPSVIALSLPEARRCLEGAGVEVVGLVETAPPGRRPSGPLRVVGQRIGEKGVELVVAASVALSEERDNHD